MGIDGALYSEQNVCMLCLYSAVFLGGVTGDHQVLNEDSRTCPAEIIHLNCMGDGESGLSACVFPPGEDKSLQVNTHFHESGPKINSKEKKHSLVMSVQ